MIAEGSEWCKKGLKVVYRQEISDDNNNNYSPYNSPPCEITPETLKTLGGQFFICRELYNIMTYR